jgi:hypothetical protein
MAAVPQAFGIGDLATRLTYRQDDSHLSEKMRRRAQVEPNLPETPGQLPQPQEDLLPLRLAAIEAGVAEPTLRRYVTDGKIPHTRRKGVLHVPRAACIAFRDGGRIVGTSPTVRALEAVRGSTAADCFKRFRNNEALIEIVEELALDPGIVEGLWYKWQHLQKIQLSSASRCMLEHHGGIECDGLPSAQTALCGRHAARARILSQEEEVTLTAMRSGQHVDTAVCCLSCGQMAGRGLCTACVSKISIAVDNGVFVVSVGERQVKVLPLEDIRRLLEKETSPIPPPVGEIPSPPPAEPASMAHSTEETRALLAEVQERLKR